MTDPVTLLMHSGHLIVFTWTPQKTLSVDLWKPSQKDSNPWLLSGSTLLSEDEAKAFLRNLSKRRLGT